MIYLTIINSVLIILILINLYRVNKLDITFYKSVTFWEKTLISYHITIFGYMITIPIRNARNARIDEEVHMMIAEYNDQQKLQSLSAKISHCNSNKEIERFVKEYSAVDMRLVEKLSHERYKKLRCDNGNIIKDVING